MSHPVPNSPFAPMQAIDLFAGGGGLTYGLRQAGFTVAAAVENEPHACTTLAANHSEVKIYQRDVQDISGRELLEAATAKGIDLLAGCPPCQGFTSLTAKYRRADPRNNLIHEMTRLVQEIQPRAIMMENVPGLAQRGRELLNRFCAAIKELDYRPEVAILQVADYGVPQYRRRLVLLAGRGFVIPMPVATHDRDGQQGRSRWRTVREALQGTVTTAPLTLHEARKKGGAPHAEWHVVRTLSATNRLRIQHAQPGGNWSAIPESLRPPCHRGNYRGFPNVYGRMMWDAPAPTITGGCTTFSKGRFGHPEEDRTISVREAALLQTFPYDYRFETPFMDYACNIIGNALPCVFAEAVARQCYKHLRAHEDKSKKA